MDIDGQIIHIKITASSLLIGVEISACQTESVLHSVVQDLVEDVVGVLLNGEGRVSEKGKIFDSSWIIEVNEDTGSFASDWLKDSLQKTNEVKGRERFGDL